MGGPVGLALAAQVSEAGCQHRSDRDVLDRVRPSLGHHELDVGLPDQVVTPEIHVRSDGELVSGAHRSCRRVAA